MYNKTAILCTLLCISQALLAQVEKGSVYPGITAGQMIFRFNNSSIQPSVEIGISRHSTLGVFYYSTRYRDISPLNAESYSTQKGGGISFAVYSYFNRRSRWGWYVNSIAGLYDIRVIEKRAGYNFLNNRYRHGELRVTPGIFFTPTPKLMLFANIGGFSVSNNRYEFLSPGSSFLSQLSVGLRISLGGSKKRKDAADRFSK